MSEEAVKKKVATRKVVYWSCLNPKHRHREKTVATRCVARDFEQHEKKLLVLGSSVSPYLGKVLHDGSWCDGLPRRVANLILQELPPYSGEEPSFDQVKEVIDKMGDPCRAFGAGPKSKAIALLWLRNTYKKRASTGQPAPKHAEKLDADA